MTLYVLPAIMLQLSMPLFCLIVMAAYLKGFVLLAIVAVVSANAAVLSVPCWKKRLTSGTNIYGSFIWSREAFVTEEKNSILLTAVMTSWIAPNTVWSSSIQLKSYFLLATSFTTFVGYAVALAATYSVAKTFNASFEELPPVTHCFEAENVSSTR